LFNSNLVKMPRFIIGLPKYFLEADMRRAKKTILSLPVVFLVACGGGSSGDPAPAAATVFPIESAVIGYLTSPRSFTTSYTDPATGDVFSFDYVHTPGADSTFEGSPSKTVTLTIDLKRNGVSQGASSQVDYFQTSPFKSLGTIDNTGQYAVVSNQVPLPATAKVGDGGSLHTSTTYTNSSKSAISETSVATWDLQAGPANTAYFCANSTVKYMDGTPDVSGSECYRIDAGGAVVGNRLTITTNGQTRVFTN
jgi:hypothetical protein